ncbi:type IV pilus modification protein PilV [Legionella quinlivanii]|uniref:type IV pilus modification protein PilV n=1 Tax=Legionella quinlivanii TaxID=45073 RepID=UPI00224447B0|nr:type IV pilus modification protein PilV [Legionella quinlivanii]MCW8450208.1 type IV pilus modification protein PilV [Legionella quinlivanii]
MHMLSKQEGFSLLEVLISTVILAIGLLGIASLQTNAVRYNHSAYLRSIAISQMSNMFDRMLANPAGVQAGSYNNMSGLSTNPNCNTCSMSQIAQRDLYQWNQANSQLLPNGQGSVTRNGNVFTIIIRWDNDRTGATGMNCSGNYRVDLACLTMDVEL